MVFIINILNFPSHSVPKNPRFLKDMKQFATIGGLGDPQFHEAVCGVKAIYEYFKTHITSEGFYLRDWSPRSQDGNLVLTFSSRYLTRSKDAEGETVLDLVNVDPYNVLRPLLVGRTEKHVGDNQVEFWERTVGEEQK